MALDPSGITSENWGESSDASNKSAQKHFFTFLLQHEFPRNPELKQQLYGSEPIPDGATNIAYLKSCNTIRHITIEVMNKFAYYLAKDAKNLRSPDQPLQYETASRYFSSIKECLLNMYFHSSDSSPLADKDKIRKIRSSMFRSFVERQRRIRQPLSTSHTQATRPDIMKIVMLCMWLNSKHMAAFALFVVSLFLFSARGHECSEMKFKEIKFCQPSEFCVTGFPTMDVIIQVLFFRDKTFVEQHLHVFPDRDSLFLDWYFLLAYNMVFHSDSPSEDMFSEFKTADPVSQDDEEDDNDNNDGGGLFDIMQDEDQGATAATQSTKRQKTSQVSKAFTDKMKHVFDLVDSFMSGTDDGNATQNEYEESLIYVSNLTGDLTNAGNLAMRPTEGLTSHSAKRGGINAANDNPNIKSAWVCVSAGWIMKAVHTIFDYLDINPGTDRQVSRAKSNWKTLGPSGELGGGRPPSLEALRNHYCGENEVESHEVAVEFARRLFYAYSAVPGANDPQLQQILTASTLARLPSYVRHLQMHPERRFGRTEEDCYQTCHFLRLVLFALRGALQEKQVHCAVDELPSLLKKWSELIERDFVARNFEYVPLRDLVRVRSHYDDNEMTEEQRNLLSTAFTMDSRPLLDHLRGSNRLAASHHMQLFELTNEVRQLNERMTRQETLLRTMHGLLSDRSPVAHQNATLANTLDRHQDVPGDIGQHSQAMTTTANPNPALRSDVVPKQLTGLKVKEVFVAWHTQRYYLATGSAETKRTLSKIRKCVAFFTLFLPSQVPALPEGVYPGDTETEGWLRNLTLLSEQAWATFTSWWRSNQPQQEMDSSKNKGPPIQLTPFVKFLEEVGQGCWPEGPIEKSSFGIKSRDQLATQLNTTEQNRQSRRGREANANDE